MARSRRRGTGILLACLAAAGCEDGSSSVAGDEPDRARRESASRDAPPERTQYIKAQLNDRLVTFSQVAPGDNFIVGRNLHLEAATRDGETFEIIGVDILPEPLTTPVVLQGDRDSRLTVRYTRGGATEWSDDQAVLRLSSFEKGVLQGSLSSKLLRPNKPATPIEITGGLFDVDVARRSR